MESLDADLRNVLERTGTDEPTVVIGTTPSATPHLGNVFTFVKGCVRVQDAAEKLGMQPQYAVYTDDLELDDTRQKKMSGVLRYSNPDFRETISYLETFLSMLSSEMGLQIDFKHYSEIEPTPDYRTVLKRSLEHYISPKDLFVQHDACVFASRIESARDREGQYLWRCRNRRCSSRHEREITLDDKDIVFTGQHWLLAPVRDVAVGADIHIFGGDYTLGSGKQLEERAEQCGGHVQVLLGPLLLDQQGLAMHKSEGNGLDIDVLLENPFLLPQLIDLAYEDVSDMPFDMYKDVLP